MRQIGYGYVSEGVLTQFEEILEPSFKSKDDGVFCLCLHLDAS